MDEAKHIADAAPAEPQASAAGDAALPARPPGDAATPPAREPAGAPPQPSPADPGRNAAPEAAAVAPATPDAVPAAPRGEAPEAAPEPLAEAEAPAPAGAGPVPRAAAATEPEPPAVVEAATAAAPAPQAIEAAAAAEPERMEQAAAAGAPEPRAVAAPAPEPPAMEAAAIVEPGPAAAETAATTEPEPLAVVGAATAPGPDPQVTVVPAAAEPERVEAAAGAETEPQAAAVGESGPRAAEAAAVAEPEPPAVAAADAEPEPDTARAPAEPERQPQVVAPPAATERAPATATAPPEPRAEAFQGWRGGESAALAAPPSRTAAARTAPAWPRRSPPVPARGAGYRTGRGYLAYLRLALMGITALAVGYVALVLALVVLYRWVDPPTSTLMLGQRLTGMRIEQRWVPLERMSPHLVKAVVLSEDGSFCRHRGVDWRALEEAIESARGGSTITMQVVKNLFLWPSRSYLRKAIEIALAYVVELIWPKRRILEIYLNIAEWGDGVFGAEAAAQLHFRKAAARLTAAEAALLAVALPNPAERDASSPSPGMNRLATRLLVRMTASRASLACVRMGARALYGAPRQAHLLGRGD